MKSLVIFVLIMVVTFSIIGAGVGPFFDNVEKGADKVYQSDEFQTVLEKGKRISSQVLDWKLSVLDNKANNEQLATAQRIQELTNKGASMSEHEFNELRTLVDTYERNWG